MGCKHVRLDDVAVLTPGFAFKSKDFGGYDAKVIKITDVSDDCHVSGLTGVDLDSYSAANLEKYLVNPGDYFLAMTGSIGKIGRITDGKAYLNQRVLGVRPSASVNKGYLWQLLNTVEFKNHLLTHIDSHSVQANISAKSVGSFEFTLPDQTVQKTIATILGAFDLKMQINSALNSYLEELGKAIWRKAIETSGTLACIGNIAAEIVTGKTPSTKVPEYYGDKYPFITIPDMHSNVWLCSTERRLSETGNRAQPKKLVPRGAVLVSCIATLGLVGIVQKPSHFNQQINAVVPTSEGDEFFLYYAMRSITQALLGIGATGSATLNVNKSAFSQIEIPWLEGKAMAGFVQTVRPIFETIEANSIESLRLRKLSDSLLPKLMSGEIDVSKVMF